MQDVEECRMQKSAGCRRVQDFEVRRMWKYGECGSAEDVESVQDVGLRRT